MLNASRWHRTKILLMTSPEARRVIELATGLGVTLAVAESLTGGDLCGALVAVPGASQVLRGGVVAYAEDVKTSLLGVPGAVLAEHGPVSAEVSLAMARGVRERLGADIGIGTTGAAGPEPHGGQAPGTAFVAIAVGDGAPRAVKLHLDGTREAVRAAVCEAALRELADTLSARS